MKTLTLTRVDNITGHSIETIVADHHNLNDPNLLVQILVDSRVLDDTQQAERPHVTSLTEQIRVLTFEHGGRQIMYKIQAVDGSRMQRCQIVALVERDVLIRHDKHPRQPYFINYGGLGLKAARLDGLVDIIEVLQP